MNSKQRRKAYRAMPKPGTQIVYHNENRTRATYATVVGRADPSSINGIPGAFGVTHSTFRVKAALNSGGTVQPLLTRIFHVA